MKLSWSMIRTSFVLLLLLLINLGYDLSVRAQGGGLFGDTSREKVAVRSTNAGSSSNSGSSTPPVRRGRPVVISKKVYIKPTTGSLSVATAPNASIFLQRLDRNDDPDEASMPADGSQAVFNELVPGRYRVSAQLAGYTSAERVVEISRNEQEGILLDLKPLPFSVTVTTNVPQGEIRYGRVESRRRDPVTNQEKYDPVGSTCMMPIENGQATLNNLQAGTYGVDVRPADVGYTTRLLVFTLSGSPQAGLQVEATVERIESSSPFSATWTTGEWDLPIGWRTGRSMQVNNPGIALPHEETKRHYRNFKLVSDIRLTNGVGVSFVIRARDAQNYYLVRVTGANDQEPLKLIGYVVKNGIRQPPFTVINLSHLRDVLAPGKYFNVEMNVRGSRIDVVLNDSELGRQYPLGGLTESFNTYLIGAVGVAGIDNERTEIGSFTISPLP